MSTLDESYLDLPHSNDAITTSSFLSIRLEYNLVISPKGSDDTDCLRGIILPRTGPLVIGAIGRNAHSEGWIAGPSLSIHQRKRRCLDVLHPLFASEFAYQCAVQRNR